MTGPRPAGEAFAALVLQLANKPAQRAIAQQPAALAVLRGPPPSKERAPAAHLARRIDVKA